MTRYWLWITLCFLSSQTFAADPLLQCDPVKFIDRNASRLSYAESLAYLNSITKETWSTAKDNISAGITLPIEVPLTAEMDYDHFEQFWNKYKTSTKYFRSVRDDRVAVSSAASRNNVFMYKTCLAGATGLSAFGTLIDDTTLAVTISWRPSPAFGNQTIPQSISVTLDQSGATNSKPSVTIPIGINGSIEKTYHLTPGEPFDLTATETRGNSSSVHVLVPRIFKCTITTEPQTLTKYFTFDDENNHQVDNMRNVYMNTWKAQLEELGHKNVIVKYEGMGAERGHYTYTFNYSAKVDGTSKYGPDPRCTADEAPAAASSP